MSPTPVIALVTKKNAKSVDIALPIDPIIATISPNIVILRLPKISANLAKGADSAAIANIQDSIIHPKSGADNLRSFSIAGMATFMAVKPILPNRFAVIPVYSISFLLKVILFQIIMY
jgi:preprotein translocase subunit SecD